MDVTLDFLLNTENEYKSELKAVKQEINVVNDQIKNIKAEISKIDANIDKTYEMFSSSQTVNIVENTEIQTKQEILNRYDKDLEKYMADKDMLEKKIYEVKNAIDAYAPPISNEDLSAKLDFIIKLIPVDKDRAILELKDIQETMFHVKH